MAFASQTWQIWYFPIFMLKSFLFDLRFVSEYMIAYSFYRYIIIIMFFEIGTQMIFDKPISSSQYLRPFLKKCLCGKVLGECIILHCAKDENWKLQTNPTTLLLDTFFALFTSNHLSSNYLHIKFSAKSFLTKTV